MIIQTERLLIEDCSLESYSKYSSKYKIGNHILVFLEELKENPKLKGWGPWFVISKSDSKVIGDIGFKGVPDNEGFVEVGYGIIPEAQKQGYATESVQAIIDWAFKSSQVKKVNAQCNEENIPSIKVLEKLKMKKIRQENRMIYWERTKIDLE